MKSWSLLAAAAVTAPLLALSATPPAPADPAPSSPATTSGATTFKDAKGDAGRRKLDIRKVTVRNTADALTVRVTFPGVRQTYGYPLGYLSVWLDTDRTRRGPEYGHFMQFWSDYRFAETRGWREHPTPQWGHSPDGACVGDLTFDSDPGRKLRYFEYTVAKREGCFTADAVRVAVTSVNEGEKDPYRPYDEPFVDHLGGRHRWTSWVPQAG
ncbi:hypothetical protein ABFT23_01600 [Nocardioides sp. C4-1]|uniref:hypothetical protein n=1 Tax=Nocardioides sp. C4-1 TaxID=3151851 RepID=UPI003265D348